MTKYVVSYITDQAVHETEPMSAKYTLQFLGDIAAVNFLVISVDKV